MVLTSVDGKTLICFLGNAPITEGMATITINDLQCGVAYNIAAQGMLDETLVGSRSTHGSIVPRSCPMTSSECITTYTVHLYVCMYVCMYVTLTFMLATVLHIKMLITYTYMHRYMHA